MLVKADLPRRCYPRQLRVESINGSAVRVHQPTPDIHQNIASAENVTTNDMSLVVEQISQVVEEEPERTNFSESDDWIAGGTLTQFEEGLAIFLRGVPSGKDDMFTCIMITMRRELRIRREADSQNEIIRRITEALVDNNLKQRGSSRTMVMNLLHGEYRNADITGYFLECRG